MIARIGGFLVSKNSRKFMETGIMDRRVTLTAHERAGAGHPSWYLVKEARSDALSAALKQSQPPA